MENGKYQGRGLIIGLPVRGLPVSFEWAMCFANANYPMNLNREIVVRKGSETGDARNIIVKRALQVKSKYLWFLDDDVAPPFFAIRKLIYDLEQAKDPAIMIAAGIYASKTNPAEPTIYDGNNNGPYWSWKKNQIIDIPDLRVATGCMVIKTELFTLIDEPWFKTVQTDGDGDVLGSRQTDDLYFCDKVRAAGYRMIADGSVLCVHWDLSKALTGEMPTPYVLPEDSYPMKQEIESRQIAI
jgi:hypothetical protein